MISTYTVTPQKQLIDLNGNMKNFELNFVVKASDSSKQFEAIVADQKMLDNNEELEYKKVTGSIGGTLVADKDVYQNYYLILKIPEGESPHDVTIEINKHEIPPNIEDIQPQPQIQSQSGFKSFLSRCYNINWKSILILVVIGVIIFLFFKFFMNKKNNSSVTSEESSVLPSSKLINSPNSPISSIASSPVKSSVTSTPQNDILSRINNLL